MRQISRSFCVSRRRWLRTSVFAVASVVALPLVFSGCGNSSNGNSTSTTGGGGGGGSTVRILSPHGDEITNEFRTAFNAKYPNIKLEFVNQDGSGGIAKYVLSQFKGKGPDQGINFDIMFGGGAEIFQDIDDAKALQPLASTYNLPKELNGVPLYAPDKNWVGAALSGFGILANKSIADRDGLPLPKSWADFADAKYKGRIELADPRQSGSSHTIDEVILQTNGWEKGWQILTAMAANSSGFISISSQLLSDVKGGQAVFAPAIDFYGRTAVADSGGKLVYIEPQGQNIITPDPIGLLRGAPNKADAQKFVDFVMSTEGQKLWMFKKDTPGGPKGNTLYRQSALPALYQPISGDSTITTDPYKTKTDRDFDSKMATERYRPLNDLIGSVLVDNLSLLKRAWSANPDASKVAYLPVTEKELAELTKKWDDPAFRSTTMAKWKTDAVAKYNGLAS